MIQKTALVSLLLLATPPAMAQLGLPQIGDPLGQVDGILDETIRPVSTLARNTADLARDRLDRLTEFVRQNRASVEFDDLRQPARRGEAILLNPDSAAIETARREGYKLIEQAEVEGLDIGYARLAIPDNEKLADGLKRLRRLLPGMAVTANHLHFTSGATNGPEDTQPSAGSVRSLLGGTVGVIDGGMTVSRYVVSRRGFAAGGPKLNDHAIAIGSLLAGAGVERIWNADVYGSDPAGGDALAIARALGWMAVEGVPVVSISLVGPSNPLLEKAVTAARAKDMVVVAAVGNDGAAAPAAYPASYSGVVAVTGVDGKGRVLIEAGKALHLDYAAPGADLTALAADGKRVRLRGTSFAAPLAAARIAAHRASGQLGRALFTALDREAEDLGQRGSDKRYGRGVLCGSCRRGI